MDEEIKDLLDSIERQTCVVFIGADIATSRAEQRPENALSEHLKRFHSEDISVYENGWFHYKNKRSRNRVHRSVKAFYSNQQYDLDLLKKLVNIPFKLYISMTPSTILNEVFKNLKQPFQFGIYDKSQARIHNPYGSTPSKNSPLIYNFFGSLTEINSLILTFDDFYQYLETILGSTRSAFIDDELMQDHIIDADHYLFLGVPLDQWSVHLFMRVIDSFDSTPSVSHNEYLEDITKQHCKEQYGMTFIEGQNVDRFLGILEDHQRKIKQTRLIDFNSVEEQASPEKYLDLLKYLYDKLLSTQLHTESLLKQPQVLYKGLEPYLEDLLSDLMFLSHKTLEVKTKCMVENIEKQEFDLLLKDIKKTLGFQQRT